MKVVLDSSVLFSAFLGASRTTKDLFHLARLGRFELCLSESLLAEAAQALLRKPHRFAYTSDDVIEHITLLATVAAVIDDPPAIPPACRDPKDDHVLPTAVAVGADFLVTGDADLLVMGTYEGTRIVSVRDFVDRFGS